MCNISNIQKLIISAIQFSLNKNVNLFIVQMWHMLIFFNICFRLLCAWRKMKRYRLRKFRPMASPLSLLALPCASPTCKLSLRWVLPEQTWSRGIRTDRSLGIRTPLLVRGILAGVLLPLPCSGGKRNSPSTVLRSSGWSDNWIDKRKTNRRPSAELFPLRTYQGSRGIWGHRTNQAAEAYCHLELRRRGGGGCVNFKGEEGNSQVAEKE